MYSTRSSCQILMEVEFSQQLFEEHSNTKFNKNRPVGVELFHADWRTDRYDGANSWLFTIL